MAQPKPPNNPVEATRKYAKYLDGVLQMALSITIGTLAGKKLDEWMGNARPWGMLAGVLTGLTMAFYLIFRRIASEK